MAGGGAFRPSVSAAAVSPGSAPSSAFLPVMQLLSAPAIRQATDSWCNVVRMEKEVSGTSCPLALDPRHPRIAPSSISCLGSGGNAVAAQIDYQLPILGAEAQG